MKKIIEEVLGIAHTQIGVHEVGVSNTGTEVDRYLAAAGLPPGNPWCASFVFWVIEQASRKLEIANVIPRTGYCPLLATWGLQHGLLNQRPQVGDIFLRWATVAGKFRASHTGIVTAVNGVSFKTIEGNTNLGGSREGTSVLERSRSNGSQYKFVSWWKLVESQEQPASYKLVIGANRVSQSLPVVSGRTLCPVRLWGEWMHKTVEWNSREQVVLLDGKELGVEVSLIGGSAYAPLRDLADDAGLQLHVDDATATIYLS